MATSLPAGVAARLGRGTVLVVAAEACALPAALVVAALAGRGLGPDGYGLFALSAAIVAWVEWTLASVLSRAIVLEVSRAPAAVEVQTAALQANAAMGTLALGALWLLAPAMAALLDEPRLVPPLRLLAFDVPLFTLAAAHRSLLVARGAFGARAALPLARWTTRVVLVGGLLAFGWSITGVIVASIVASAAELAIARTVVAPPLFVRPRLHVPYVADALPFLALGIMLRLFDRIDLLLFKSLGGTTVDAGLYGAAKSLATALSVLSMAFPPLLLATLSRLFADGHAAQARALGRRSLRAVCWLAPLAGVAWGAGGPIVAMVFGEAFAPAGPLLAPLVTAGVAQIFVAAAIMILSAAGRPHAFLVPAAAMLATAVMAGALAIPRMGAEGAALAAAGSGLLGVTSALWLMRRMALTLPRLTLVSVGFAVLAAAVACRTVAGRLPTVAAVVVGLLAAGAVLWSTGELRGDAAAVAAIHPPTAPATESGR